MRTIAIHTHHQVRAVRPALAKGIHVAVVQHIKCPVHPNANLRQQAHAVGISGTTGRGTPVWLFVCVQN